MKRDTCRYEFDRSATPEDIEATLLLATMGAESLHGEVDVRLDAVYDFDPMRRICQIDATTPVGRDLNRLFVGFVVREFGPSSFRVKRSIKDGGKGTVA